MNRGVDGCPYCHRKVHLLPGHNQSDFVVVDMHRAKQYGCKVGVYHRVCYHKIKYGEIEGNSEIDKGEVCV